jgi:hypothetical protein
VDWNRQGGLAVLGLGGTLLQGADALRTCGYKLLHNLIRKIDVSWFDRSRHAPAVQT